MRGFCSRLDAEPVSKTQLIGCICNVIMSNLIASLKRFLWVRGRFQYLGMYRPLYMLFAFFSGIGLCFYCGVWSSFFSLIDGNWSFLFLSGRILSSPLFVWDGDRSPLINSGRVLLSAILYFSRIWPSVVPIVVGIRSSLLFDGGMYFRFVVFSRDIDLLHRILMSIFEYCQHYLMDVVFHLVQHLAIFAHCFYF